MKTAFTVLFALVFGLAIGQNAWKDADLLNKWFELDPVRFRAEVDNSVEVDESSIMEIVAKYCPEAVKMEVEAEGVVQRVNLNICFQGNPFISLHQYAQADFSNVLPPNFNPNVENSGGQVTPGGRGPAGGNLITNLADGLAIFLARRTKEELNATFFEGLQEKLENEPTYRALFPATYDLVYVIGHEIYNYNAYLESLREVFMKDLEVLPLNLRQYSQDHSLIKKAEFQIAIEDLLTTTHLIMDAQKPKQIIDYWANSAAIQDSLRWLEIPNGDTRNAMRDMAMSMKSLHLLVNSLTNESGYGWVSSNEIGLKMRDICHTYLYLGLLWELGDGIRFSDGKDFRGALGGFSKMTQSPMALRNYLSSLVQSGIQLRSEFETLKDSIEQSNTILNDEYLRFATQVFRLLEKAKELRNYILLPDWKIENGKPISSPNPKSKSISVDSLQERLMTVAHQFFDLEINVRQHHYTLAVTNLTRILTELLNEEDFKYKKEFLRHVNFMATVAEAKTSEEVSEAIELFALPPGSSRMKKQSKWSISLNSYGGLGFGRENDFNDAVDAAIQKKGVLAPSAPLGIDLNKGLGDAGSLSLYAQVIDVGAIFAYRFSDETSQIPELKFQNIVAPGGYLIYGFGNNIPASIGVGAQLGPNLRKINPDLGLEVSTTNAWRLGFILSVDIPVTHFYTK